MIVINDELEIPEEELRFTASRSSGPGGQNVNKVSTRVTLLFDVVDSPTLSEDHKALIRARLPTRVSRAGVLRVSAQQARSQAANRLLATDRLVELLRWALSEQPERKPTRVPRAVRDRRLENKRRRARRKRERTTRYTPED